MKFGSELGLNEPRRSGRAVPKRRERRITIHHGLRSTGFCGALRMVAQGDLITFLFDCVRASLRTDHETMNRDDRCQRLSSDRMTRTDLRVSLFH